jgi:iron complex outermembrane recepter protein
MTWVSSMKTTIVRIEERLASFVECSRRRAVASVLLASLATVAGAQQANAPAPTMGGTDSVALDEIVVTAQKRSERLQDVPISITALGSSELQRTGVQTTADLPSVVSGLVWSNQGAWVEPNIRGVYTNVAAIGSGSPIAIYLDGIYQASQAGTIFDLPDVSRIEVLKGPQGTLFGRNATGGAISIFTLDPSFTPTGKIEASAGAYSGGSSDTSGHYSVKGFASGPLIQDSLAGSISASYDRTDGYLIDDVTGGRGGKIENETVRGKLLWKISDSASLLLTGYYSHVENDTGDSWVPQNGVTVASQYPGHIIPTQPWHFSYDGDVPGVRQDIRGASAKGTFDFSGGTLTSLTGFTNVGVANTVDVAAAYSPACVAAFACLAAESIPRDQYVSQEFDFASVKYGGFSYVAGLFALYDNAREHDTYNMAAFSDDTVVTTHSIAVFAEGTYAWTDAFSTVVGVRVSRDSLNAVGRDFTAEFAEYADKSWDSVTPHASLIYKFNSNLNAYFTYSQGFKAGIVSGQIGTPPYPQPASPEKIYAYEVGLKAATETYSANLAAFYYDYRDLQVEVFNDLVTTPLNAATAEIYGLDLDATAKLTDDFQLRVDSSWLPTAKYLHFPTAIAFVPPLTPAGLTTDNKFDASGSRMLTTPTFTGTLSGTYGHDIQAGRLEATASVYHSGSYRWEYTGTVTTDAYTLLNGQISFAPAGTTYKYTIYGKNLTNRAYVEGALATAQANAVGWAPPRELGVRFAYSF